MKLLLIALALVSLNEASISNLQLVVPEDSYTLLASGKISTSSNRGNIALSNALNDEENYINGEEELDGAEVADGQSESLPANGASVSASQMGPASITRIRPLSALGGSLSSSSGSVHSRSSLVISSSASSTASASGSALSPSASAKSTATIQHRILPAESIPLPITISQRSGLRTVIAPETITIQQPTVAKIGEVVQQIPTSVSHQRQTVVHKHARVVTPIVAPGVRTITSQIVRAYHTPLVYAPQQPTIQVVNN